MCVTIELYTTFICKGVENIEGVINDGWQLATTWREHIKGNIGDMQLPLAQLVSKNTFNIF